MTVNELIEELMNFCPSRLVIIDQDGNTDDCPHPELWSDEEDSPVALFINL